jgi:cystathionine beta-lyase
MSKNGELNRRAFLRSAQMTALVGAGGTGTSLAIAAGKAPGVGPGKYDFDTPYNRVGSDSIKWDVPIRNFHMDRLIAGMGVADMDFRCAPAITKALQKRVQHEVWGYLDMPKDFSEGIIRWNKRRYGIDINPDLLGITNGVHPGLITALKTFSPPGGKVLLTTPTYAGFYGDIGYCRLKPEDSPMKQVNGRYSIDFEDLERRISPETKTLILCNPQNPTGNCWSREELTRVGEICLRRGVVVLADEIHCDFVNKGQKYTPFSTLENRDIVNNSVIFKAASKSFGLAAMKCAWYFTTNPDYFAAMSVNNWVDLSTLGMIANKAAYAGGEDWLDQVVSYVDGNHDYVQSFIPKNMPLIKIGAKAEGTYLVWLDVTDVAKAIGASELAAEVNKNRTSTDQVTAGQMAERWFVEKAKVQLVPGKSCGAGGENHMRMNIATSRKTLELALNSISNALRKA